MSRSLRAGFQPVSDHPRAALRGGEHTYARGSRAGNEAEARSRLDDGMTTSVPIRRGRWIEHWDPDDETFWAETGERIARKNLVLSMFAEHIGFSVWVLWTIVVLNLANHGINLSVSELFLLTLIPNLVGSMLRIPYTFAVPRFGGRAWTTVSAALLCIPTVLLAVVVP